MSDKLTQDIRAIVDDIFKQKEEVAMRKETEEALLSSAGKINELVESLEAKDKEAVDLKTKLDELEETVAELSDKVSELETEKENLEKEKSEFDEQKTELLKRAETAEEGLEDIKKDQLAQARFEELKKKGIGASGDDAIKAQIVKIREMGDEDFEAYTAERVELRESILTELENSEDSVSTEKETSEEVNDKESASEEDLTVEGMEEDEEAAANSKDSINPMKAVAALLNMESIPTDDVLNRYRELGKAMAAKYTERKGE